MPKLPKKPKTGLELHIIPVTPDPKLRGRELYIDLRGQLFRIEMTGYLGREKALEVARAIEKVMRKPK